MNNNFCERNVTKPLKQGKENRWVWKEKRGGGREEAYRRGEEKGGRRKKKGRGREEKERRGRKIKVN